MKWNEKLRVLRAMKKSTQQELAEELNVSVSSISAYEAGKAEPNISKMERIASFYGSDVLTIFFDTSDKLREDN